MAVRPSLWHVALEQLKKYKIYKFSSYLVVSDLLLETKGYRFESGC